MLLVWVLFWISTHILICVVLIAFLIILRMALHPFNGNTLTSIRIYTIDCSASYITDWLERVFVPLLIPVWVPFWISTHILVCVVLIAFLIICRVALHPLKGFAFTSQKI